MFVPDPLSCTSVVSGSFHNMTAPAGIAGINAIPKSGIHILQLQVVPPKAKLPVRLSAYDNKPDKHENNGYRDMGFVVHIMDRKTTGLKQTVCPHFM